SEVTMTSTTTTEPWSGDSNQPSMDSNVVFPLPEGPMTKERVPRLNMTETPRNGQTRAPPSPNETVARSTPRNRLEVPSWTLRSGSDRKSTRLNSSHQIISYA